MEKKPTNILEYFYSLTPPQCYSESKFMEWGEKEPYSNWGKEEKCESFPDLQRLLASLNQSNLLLLNFPHNYLKTSTVDSAGPKALISN